MRKEKILVIDDDQSTLISVKRILKRSGFEVITANNGRIGLRIALKETIDLILVDVFMSKMSGYDFLRRYKRLEKRQRKLEALKYCKYLTNEVPIIFLTGCSAQHQQLSGLNAGAVDYITKPFYPDELRARVKCHLRMYNRIQEFIEVIENKNENKFESLPKMT